MDFLFSWWENAVPCRRYADSCLVFIGPEAPWPSEHLPTVEIPRILCITVLHFLAGSPSGYGPPSRTSRPLRPPRPPRTQGPAPVNSLPAHANLSPAKHLQFSVTGFHTLSALCLDEDAVEPLPISGEAFSTSSLEAFFQKPSPGATAARHVLSCSLGDIPSTPLPPLPPLPTIVPFRFI